MTAPYVFADSISSKVISVPGQGPPNIPYMPQCLDPLSLWMNCTHIGNIFHIVVFLKLNTEFWSLLGLLRLWCSSISVTKDGSHLFDCYTTLVKSLMLWDQIPLLLNESNKTYTVQPSKDLGELQRWTIYEGFWYSAKMRVWFQLYWYWAYVVCYKPCYFSSISTATSPLISPYLQL